MGGDHLPLLPGTAQLGGKILHAGHTGEHPPADPTLLQQGEQSPGPGMKSCIPAVQHAGALPRAAGQDLHNLSGFCGKKPPGLRRQSAALHQTAGADEDIRPLQSSQRAAGQGGGVPRSHADEGHFHALSSF